MSVCPHGLPALEAVRDAMAILEAAGLASIVVVRPAIGGEWRATACQPLLAENEWEPSILYAMAMRAADDIASGAAFGATRTNQQE